jgi:acyl-CoA reductase-like NAD-dependent aldehyde dehydrogenase
MGGKNSLVVLNDADLELAVPAAVAGSFFYQGQICMASSRICVQQDILPAFMKAFVRATEQLKTGDLRDPQTMIGPVINPAQRQRIKDHIRDAVDHGAQVVTGAHWHGNVCEPTILANVDAGMHCFSQETFGPVTAVLKAESADHALSLANAAGCGLSASVFTASLDKAMTFAEQLQAGMVHVNATTIQEEPHIPFGGVGDSGLGREGTILSADDLTEWKWITLRG